MRNGYYLTENLKKSPNPVSKDHEIYNREHSCNIGMDDRGHFKTKPISARRRALYHTAISKLKYRECFFKKQFL